MSRHLRCIRFVVWASTALASAYAGANGIVPPRPRDAVVVVAVCHENAGDRQHTLYRAQTGTYGAPGDALRFQVGAATEDIPIRALAEIEIAGAKPDRTGFVTVTLLRRGNALKEKASLRVRDGASALRLIGYSESGSLTGVDLAKCQRIEFPEPRIEPDSIERKRSMKKA